VWQRYPGRTCSAHLKTTSCFVRTAEASICQRVCTKFVCKCKLGQQVQVPQTLMTFWQPQNEVNKKPLALNKWALWCTHRLGINLARNCQLFTRTLYTYSTLEVINHLHQNVYDVLYPCDTVLKCRAFILHIPRIRRETDLNRKLC
jgi:hypothetical protein